MTIDISALDALLTLYASRAKDVGEQKKILTEIRNRLVEADTEALAGTTNNQILKIDSKTVVGPTAAGDVNHAITFTSAFENACDAVVVVITAWPADYNHGGFWVTNITKTGFTWNVRYTGAPAVAGNVTITIVAVGH